MGYPTLDQASITMGDLPTWISALAAIILAIITYKYMRLVKGQSDVMAEQGRIMQESMKRDQLTRKYENLSREMDDLIGPLFSKMDDHTAPYFHAVYHSHEGSPFYQEIYAFWRDIKKNIYLAPRDLRENLNNYLDVRQKYRRVSMDRATPGEELTATRALFDKSIEDLKPKIKDRYNELSGQIAECKRELRID
jgi:hypothetical protein